jgi:hypothetical protein
MWTYAFVAQVLPVQHQLHLGGIKVRIFTQEAMDVIDYHLHVNVHTLATVNLANGFVFRVDEANNEALQIQKKTRQWPLLGTRTNVINRTLSSQKARYMLCNDVTSLVVSSPVANIASLLM